MHNKAVDNIFLALVRLCAEWPRAAATYFCATTIIFKFAWLHKTNDAKMQPWMWESERNHQECRCIFEANEKDASHNFVRPQRAVISHFARQQYFLLFCMTFLLFAEFQKQTYTHSMRFNESVKISINSNQCIVNLIDLIIVVCSFYKMFAFNFFSHRSFGYIELIEIQSRNMCMVKWSNSKAKTEYAVNKTVVSHWIYWKCAFK